ncbi:MAG: cardiolipin synthase [Butyricicoccaceae bacterium]
MHPKFRKHVRKFFVNRRSVSIALLLIQVVLTVTFLYWVSQRHMMLSYFLALISLCVVVWLIRKNDNPAYKIPWIIVILLLPPLGGLFYLLWGNTPFNRARLVKIRPLEGEQLEQKQQSSLHELCTRSPRHRRLGTYLHTVTDMPVWKNTSCEYFPLGEFQYESMLLHLKKAERFIFMEYFIIDPGEMWDSILAILAEKAAAGVDVRIMYDDMGCISTLPSGYRQYLQSLGIRVVAFNRFIPMLNTYLNYRNHRKICIIDGNTGYMGGINLADEYINRRERFGHWKDTGFCLTGDGVANLTAMFLQLWDFATGSAPTPLEEYLPTVSAESDGYVQPFSDSPLDQINVSEAAYMHIINNASRYVYITTPYLTLDNEMITALCTAAQSGVDVRIVTPGIPDKKMVYLVTRSYYAQLIEAGVKIYEYTPGFIHAKMIVSDNDTAIVGTINMDFRSFYLHFECACAFYRSSVVDKVREDILNCISKSRKIDEDFYKGISWLTSIAASLLRIFAPIL